MGFHIRCPLCRTFNLPWIDLQGKRPALYLNLIVHNQVKPRTFGMVDRRANLITRPQCSKVAVHYYQYMKQDNGIAVKNPAI
jgi:hypothetical protein